MLWLSRREQLRQALELPNLQEPDSHQVNPDAALPADFDPLDGLRGPFVAWFNRAIQIDLQALTNRAPSMWFTRVGTLHNDCCRWMAERSQVVPPSLPEFRSLLLELACEFCEIGGVEFVQGVMLGEDMEDSTLTAATGEPKSSKGCNR